MAAYHATASAIVDELGSTSPAEDKATSSAELTNLGGCLPRAGARGGDRTSAFSFAERSAFYHATPFARDFKLGGEPPACLAAVVYVLIAVENESLADCSGPSAIEG